jgi:hypothetical protein
MLCGAANRLKMTEQDSSSSSSQTLSPGLVLRALALAAMCAIGFADMYSYSMPDAFLGQVLAAQGASSANVMLALVSMLQCDSMTVSPHWRQQPSSLVMQAQGCQRGACQAALG